VYVYVCGRRNSIPIVKAELRPKIVLFTVTSECVCVCVNVCMCAVYVCVCVW